MTAPSTRVRRNTNPPSARGSGCGRAAGLLTRGSPPCRLPGPEASGTSARERLPSQRRDRPGLTPGSLSARRTFVRRPYHGPKVTLDRFLRLWGPVIVWAAVIFALSSVPSLNSGLGTWDEVLRKCAHVTEYAILGFLLVRAIGRELPALLVGIAYAVSDEFHQHFVVGRHASPLDVLIDAVGVTVGIFVLYRLFLESRRA